MSYIFIVFFRFFKLDIDTLLWTKHSSISLQEASSVEENEPVEGIAHHHINFKVKGMT